MHSIRKAGVVALVAGLMVMLGTLRPMAETPEAQASLHAPGGIAALPSAAPAIPGLSNQVIPAIIGTGQPGIVSAFCFGQHVPVLPPQPCPTVGAVGQGRSGAITFEVQKLYPPDGGLPGLTFDANGSHTLVVTDNSAADLEAAIGVVTVRVNAAAATLGGTQGVNEIVEVHATDETGDTRSVQMVVVDTILAFGPTGAISTASGEQMIVVAYHCDVTGRVPLAEGSLPWAIDPDLDGSQGLDDMYDGYYTKVYDGIGPGFGYGSNSNGPVNPVSGFPDLDLPDVWCGGNTAGLFDDFVDFETDLGLFAVESVGRTLQDASSMLALIEISPGNPLGYFFPPIVDADCGEGKSVNVFDVDALWFWSQWLSVFPSQGPFEGGCDVDGWRNGVVSTMLWGTGEVGVATITAQQGGGVSTPRTINVTFVGGPALSLFLDAPATMGVEGAEFGAFVVDQDFRPVGDETVECTVEPADSVLAITPQTATTGDFLSDNPGEAVFRVVPTGAAIAAGETLTISCRLDRYRSIVAVATVTLVSTESESVDLVAGCNALASTWPDGTPIETVAEAVSPADALDAIWAFDPESGMWLGYSPDAPDVSDLTSVDQLDAFFICVNAPATLSRPVV